MLGRVGAAQGGGWLEAVRRRPVIAAVRGPDELQRVWASGVPVVFVLNCTIFDLRVIARGCRERGVLCFAHLDLIEGVGKDAAGVRLLAQETGASGLITTRSALVREARKAGLVAVQRVFLLDSGSLATAISVAQSTRPDAVEVMPALVVPAIAHRLPFAELPPVIAGGLVQSEDDVRRLLATPVVGVSTSAASLWAFRR